MWLIFAGMAFVTSLALALYNRYAVPKPASPSTTEPA